MLCCTVDCTTAAVDSLMVRAMDSARAAVDAEDDLPLLDDVVADVIGCTTVDVVVATTPATGDVDVVAVVVVVVVGSVAAGVVMRAAKASVNPAQVGLLSGLVEH